MNEDIRLILGILQDKPATYRPIFCHAFGGVKTGVLLSHLLYWDGPSGEIFRTEEQIKEATGLTRDEQAGARKLLLSEGVVTIQRRGIPARLYYRVIHEVLLNKLRNFPQLVPGNSGNLLSENPQLIKKSINPETNPKKREDHSASQEVFDLWNSTVKNLPKSHVMTPSRRRWADKIKKHYTLDQLKEIFQRLDASDFAASGNWAGLDWVIKSEENCAKVLEGKYDNREHQNGYRNGYSREQWNLDNPIPRHISELNKPRH